MFNVHSSKRIYSDLCEITAEALSFRPFGYLFAMLLLFSLLLSNEKYVNVSSNRVVYDTKQSPLPCYLQIEIVSMHFWLNRHEFPLIWPTVRQHPLWLPVFGHWQPPPMDRQRSPNRLASAA